MISPFDSDKKTIELIAYFGTSEEEIDATFIRLSKEVIQVCIRTLSKRAKGLYSTLLNIRLTYNVEDVEQRNAIEERIDKWHDVLIDIYSPILTKSFIRMLDNSVKPSSNEKRCRGIVESKISAGTFRVCSIEERDIITLCSRLNYLMDNAYQNCYFFTFIFPFEDTSESLKNRLDSIIKSFCSTYGYNLSSSIVEPGGDSKYKIEKTF